MYNWDYKNSERKLTIRAEFGRNCTERTLKLDSPYFSQGKLNTKPDKELGFSLLTVFFFKVFEYFSSAFIILDFVKIKLEMFLGILSYLKRSKLRYFVMQT